MWTVSAIQLHPNALIVCDEDATLELHVKTCILYSSSICFGTVGRQLMVIPEEWFDDEKELLLNMKTEKNEKFNNSDDDIINNNNDE
ncbi:hypothetical protein Glove_362g61 [Diversispora epigaea]|uniref:Glucosamine-6-phosphate deaminase n=1 Tax=Diversispora epigaea TaxID=1348612 RepID=A0A397H9G5_9GLOM|nr:hypothetical protein Glove_362g61 [Diversispora epigaea]